MAALRGAEGVVTARAALEKAEAAIDSVYACSSDGLTSEPLLRSPVVTELTAVVCKACAPEVSAGASMGSDHALGPGCLDRILWNISVTSSIPNGVDTALVAGIVAGESMLLLIF